MADNQIRIFPKLREAVDDDRLAKALLDLVDHLSPEDKRLIAAEGERVLKEVKGQQKLKGSAA